MIHWLLALPLSFACASSCWCQDAVDETYTIAGVVVNADGKPVKRIRVAVTHWDLKIPEAAMTTADDGRFRFERLRPGKYWLGADTPARVRYGYGEDVGGISIVAEPGQRNENIVFRLAPRAAIHGRIIDQNGDPVEGARVQLFHAIIVMGRRKVRLNSSSVTDDSGEYRFSGLRSGTWYVVASGSPWYADQLRSAPSSPLARMGYPPTFYPGTQDPRSAAPLRLKAAQDLAADFTLVAAPGGTLDVVIRPAGSEAQVEISFEGIAGSRCLVRSATVGSESRIGGIPPGRYQVRATGSVGSRGYGEQSVQIGPTESRVELTLAEGPLVTGVVSLDGLGAIPPDTYFEMMEDTGFGHLAEVAPDGRFRIGPLRPGSYRPVVWGASGLGIPLQFRRSLVDGAPAKGQVLELSKPVKLEISASPGGTVSGYVFASGLPVPGALVVLAPRTDSPDPFDYGGLVTDSDGSFEFATVPPGNYAAFTIATDDPDDFEYANPDVVRPYLPRGQSVHVENSKTTTIRLALPEAPPPPARATEKAP